MVNKDGYTLDSVKFTFYQDTNQVNGDNDEVEELDVECLSHFGINNEKTFFMNFKTGKFGWSIENPQEFFDLLNIVSNSVKFAGDKMSKD